MSAVDVAWLRMDRQGHLMAIRALLVLHAPLDMKRLRDTLAERLIARFRRFRQRVVRHSDAAWWVSDAQFSIDRHLRTRQLASGDPEVQLQRLVSRLSSQPLPADRPLWCIDVIERVGSGCALVVRVHHCIADGMALMGVLMSLTDAHACGMPPPDTRPRQLGDMQRTAGRAEPWSTLLQPLTDAPQPDGHPAADVWTRYAELLDDPEASAQLSRIGPAVLGELLKLALMPRDQPACLQARRGGAKALAWGRPLPHAEVKAAAAYLGSTANDVLLSCATGALRRHLMQRGEDVCSLQIRALVPVNLRHRRDTDSLGNRFGLVPLLLPLHEPDPVTRVLTLGQRMQALRHSLLPPLSMGLLGALGLAPESTQSRVLHMLARRASAVMTHVPGPRAPVYLAGSRVEQLMFWVPQSGDVGLGISMLSYAGTVQIGLITDHAVLPEPQEVTALFEQEFEDLLHGLLMYG